MSKEMQTNEWTALSTEECIALKRAGAGVRVAKPSLMTLNAVFAPISPEPKPVVLRYADDIAVFFSLASPPAPSLKPVPFLVVVCVVDLFYME
jgi:hypothetical protein